MLTTTALGLFLVLNVALTLTALAVSKRQMRRSLAVRRRLGV